jgi:hypothetical protein
MSLDAETHQLIGKMNGNIETIMREQAEMKKQLASVVAMTNRWKGATTILILAGAFIGWITNLLVKGHA